MLVVVVRVEESNKILADTVDCIDVTLSSVVKIPGLNQTKLKWEFFYYTTYCFLQLPWPANGHYGIIGKINL